MEFCKFIKMIVGTSIRFRRSRLFTLKRKGKGMPVKYLLDKFQHRLPRLMTMGFVWIAVLGCAQASSSAANPSDSLTPTPADMPVRVYNAPGKYTFHDKCLFSMDMTMESGGPADPVPAFRMAELWVCVTGVLVESDLTMQFEVEYSLTPTEPDSGYVVRDTDRDNRNIFLTDDQGGRYEFTQVGGCAAKEMRTERETLRCSGWFLFPPSKPGATVFDFHYATVETLEASEYDVITGFVLTDPE
jgi:hypothetical protein